MIRILLLLFISGFCVAQDTLRLKVKKEIDSIFYSVFPLDIPVDLYRDSYVLNKIQEPKVEEKHYPLGGRFYFNIVKDEKYLPFYNQIGGPGIAVNDTIVNCSWDPDNVRLVSLNHGLLYAEASLNQEKNTLTISRVYMDKKTKKNQTFVRKYKVLKWTYYEIILKQFTEPAVNRVYIFRRKAL
ncbi:MAG: hypothetical protein K0S32_170 [Bacteroidetes bacterium]|jgi:hypothetical protein|nr:hypothetical protein [Bacteroidota bacterium]